jgi:hypothetical protein
MLVILNKPLPRLIPTPYPRKHTAHRHLAARSAHILSNPVDAPLLATAFVFFDEQRWKRALESDCK